MNQFLHTALEYASHRWHIFPCVAGTKRPATKHGVYDATTDVQQITEWWTKNPTNNIAAACGEKSGITVVDIDDNCEEWLAKLPKTLTQKTPSGGYHAIYNYNIAVRNSIRKYSGLDFRNDGGYILLSPSVASSNGIYSWLSGCKPEALADFPKELVVPEQKKEPKQAAEIPQEIWDALDHISPEEVLQRASLYLATIEPAIQGCGGHNKLLYAADRMVNGFLLTNKQAFDILSNEYNPRCQPPWDLTNERDARDFCRKIDEARKLAGEHEPGWLLGTNESVPCVSTLLARRGLLQPNPSDTRYTLSDVSKRDITTKNTIPQNLIHPPGLLGEICEWMNETALVQQPLLSLGAAITFLGALLGRKVRDKLDSRTNLYCMGVANSSHGKNDAITSIRKLAAEAGCTELLGGACGSDAALEERMAADPVKLFLWDEVGHLMSYINSGISRHNAQLVSMLMQLYSSATSVYLGREYADKKLQRVLVQPCCCIFGAATPVTFAKGIAPDQLQDGWLSRCLVFYSDDRPDKQRHERVRQPPPQHLVDQIKKWHSWSPEPLPASELAKILPNNGTYPEHPPNPIIIPETDEATQVFIDFDHEAVRHGKDYTQLDCLWKKGEENARRIAIILAVSESFDVPVISESVATFACNLVRYLLLSFERNIVPEIVSNEIERRKRKIVKLVRDGGKEGISHTELKKHTQWVLSRDRALLLDDLVQSEEILFSLDEGRFYIMP